MLHRISLGWGRLLVLSVILVAIIAFVNRPDTQTSSSSSSTKEATVRVSGTPGVDYLGYYGRVGKEKDVQGKVNRDPTDYKVDLSSGLKVVIVDLRKVGGNSGTLKAEIISADGKVQDSRETTAEEGRLFLSWSP
jgi:hypothetical protein